MTLNHNYGCFSTVAGIAANGSRLGEVAEPKAKLKNKS